jgi:CheY-like chemotaxis protein
LTDGLKDCRAADAWSRRVLLVDNLPVNLVRMRKALKGLGCRCGFARDGEAALGILDSGDALWTVLINCGPPASDGRSAALIIRKARRRENIRIICMPPGGRENRACAGCPVDGVIERPVTAEALSHWAGNSQT